MAKPIHHSSTEENSDILISVLLDRSGSMSGKESDVIGNFNAFIKEQKKLPGTARLSLVLFDDKYEQVYENTNLTEVKPLNQKTYFVRGSTALLDALGKLIASVDGTLNKPAKVLFVINTDGYENSSVEYTKDMIKALITERQENHDWQFLFIGAGVDAFTNETGAGLGLKGWQTFTASNSAIGLSNSSNYSNSVATIYRTVGAGGQTLFSAALDATEFEVDPLAPNTAGNSINTKKSRKKKVTTNTTGNN